MAKKASGKFRSIEELRGALDKSRPLPIYYIFGDDRYAVREAVEQATDYFREFIVGDFDYKTFDGAEATSEEIVDFCRSFPFGSEIKLATARDPEKLDDAPLVEYLDAPSEFAALILVGGDAAPKLNRKLPKKLAALGCIFEAGGKNERALREWLCARAGELGKRLSPDDAQLMLDLVGDDRELLAAQLAKIVAYVGEKSEIDPETLRAHAAPTKRYSVFDLQDAAIDDDRARAFMLVDALLRQGEQAIGIVAVLNRFFVGLLRIPELERAGVPNAQAARAVGAHPYYYPRHQAARRRFSDDKLYRIGAALYDADRELKSSAADERAVLGSLMTVVFLP
ncbi:MAG: DNA polymerase III subunit delta [Ignavibacteriales bacterium]|nr:DNA polymerase III subunit delta [Ignavibacteriales bacterium]